MVSDLFDFSLYVDARVEDIEQHGTSPGSWRCAQRRSPTQFSHFHHYAGLTDQQAEIAASDIWRSINRRTSIETFSPPAARNPGAAQGRRSLHQPAAAAQALDPRQADEKYPPQPLTAAPRTGGGGRAGRRRTPEVLQVADHRGVNTAGTVAARSAPVSGSASAATTTTAATVQTMLAMMTRIPARRSAPTARMKTTAPSNAKKAPRPYSAMELSPVTEEIGSTANSEQTGRTGQRCVEPHGKTRRESVESAKGRAAIPVTAGRVGTPCDVGSKHV